MNELIKAYKTALNIPWQNTEYGSILGGKMQGEGDAYARVPLIFRALQLRCDVLTGVPLYVYDDNDKELDAYQFEESLPLYDLLWKSEAALLLKGASIVLKLKNVYDKQKGLQWLNPFTIQTQFMEDEVGGHLLFWQQLPGGARFPRDKKFWTVEDFLYFREFNPLDDLGFGVSATGVALGNSEISAGVTSFLAKFFGSDAVPITMVSLPTGTQPAEVGRVEKWFKDKIANLRGSKASRVIGVSGELKVERLTSEMDTYDFGTIDTHALEGVSDAFKIPQSLLRSDSGANRSISDNDMRSFLQKTVIPRCKYFERVINPFLAEFGQRIEFAPGEMAEMQPDEVQRADALSKLKQAGIPLLAGLDMLGYDPSEEAMAMIEEAIAKAEETANRIANQPKPQEPVAPGQPKPGEADPNAKPPDPNAEPDKPVKVELDKWYRKAGKSYDKKGVALVEFQSDVIPPGVKEKVEAMLAGKSFLDTAEKLGARNSAEDKAKIQTVHDLSVEMGAQHGMKATHSNIVQQIHDHSVRLGANCGVQ
jgi:hypothetical protein